MVRTNLSTNNRVGFSKFCSLRPKWCVLAGPKGTHSVCVCTIHQNVKLMLSAIGLEKSYNEIIEMIICSRESKVCMIHRCNLCPGIQVVQNFLMQFLKQAQEPEEYFESDENEELTTDFKQWTTTDRIDLLTMKLSLNEFIELVCEKLPIKSFQLKQCSNSVSNQSIPSNLFVSLWRKWNKQETKFLIDFP